MTQAAIAFDRDGQNVSDGQAAVQQVQQDLEQQMAALAAYGDSAPALPAYWPAKGNLQLSYPHWCKAALPPIRNLPPP